MKNPDWFRRSATSFGRGLVGASVIGMAVLLSSCGGGSNGAPPASGAGGSAGSTAPTGSTGSGGSPGSGGGSTPVAQKCLLTPAAGTTFGVDANGNIHDGYDYGNCDTPVTLQNIHVTILPPDTTKTCTKADDYAGCTLADVNSGVKANSCAANIDGVPTNYDTSFKPFVKVLFSADGYTPDSSLTWNGEMKLNGHSTRCAVQKGYEIELGKGLTAAQQALVQPYHGLMNVLLKKHPYDLTRIRNSLSFYLFRSVGDMVSRPTWLLDATFTDTSGDPNTQAYLNKYGCSAKATNGNSITADCGLFEDIEEDDNWLTFHGLDPDGQLWEAQNFAFLPPVAALTPTGAGSSAFQAIIEEQNQDGAPDYDATDLIDMLNAVNGNKGFVNVNPPSDQGYGNTFETVFNQYFQPDNFRTWLAMDILAENRDTASQNYFIYKPSNSTKFYFAPWDYDGAWDFYNQAGVVNPQPRWRQGVSNWWQSPLVRRYLETTGEVGKLNAKLADLQAGVFSSTNIQNVISTALPIAGVNALESASPDNAFANISFPAGSSTSTADKLSIRGDEITHLYKDVNRPYATFAAAPEPSVVTKAMNDYNTSLLRPMPGFMAVSAGATAGSVTLGWDVSYIIPKGEYQAGGSMTSDPLVYDVYLSTSPVLNSSSPTDTSCTTDDSAIPVLANPVFSQTGTSATSATSVPVTGLATGNYYMQVIARDAAGPTGYCQIEFDTYANTKDPVTLASVNDFGVKGFSYNATTGTVGTIPTAP